jgi:hypothetical protein
VADTMSAARAMWTMFEPVHDVTYFAPEALRAFTEAGLRGYWRGYFAGRAAPLGDARAAVVTASFYNFAPAFVARAIPGVWDLITPQEAIAVREAGVAASLRRLPGGREAGAAKAAGLLRAAEDLDFAGRVLAAANAELAAYVGQHCPNVAEANATTKSSCAAVSSAREPRAARTAAMAASGGIPTATR